MADRALLPPSPRGLAGRGSGRGDFLKRQTAMRPVLLRGLNASSPGPMASQARHEMGAPSHEIASRIVVLLLGRRGNSYLRLSGFELPAKSTRVGRFHAGFNSVCSTLKRCG